MNMIKTTIKFFTENLKYLNCGLVKVTIADTTNGIEQTVDLSADKSYVFKF